MSILLEEMMDEFRYPDSINTAKAITTTSTITASNISTLTTGSAGAFTVNGALTVTAATVLNGSLTATATTTLPATVVIGAAGIIVGALSNNINPTGTSAAEGVIFINTTATGPTNRAYINTNGATGWTYMTCGA